MTTCCNESRWTHLPWWQSHQVPLKHHYTSNKLHGITYYTIVILVHETNVTVKVSPIMSHKYSFLTNVISDPVSLQNAVEIKNTCTDTTYCLWQFHEPCCNSWNLTSHQSAIYRKIVMEKAMSSGVKSAANWLWTAEVIHQWLLILQFYDIFTVHFSKIRKTNNIHCIISFFT